MSRTRPPKAVRSILYIHWKLRYYPSNNPMNFLATNVTKKLDHNRSVQSIKPSLEKIKVYARGWLNYYGIASMKNNIDDINGWLYHRIRMCIWKQWKKPKTKVRNLMRMGVPKDLAWQAGNSRRGYWFTTHTVAVNMAMTRV